MPIAHGSGRPGGFGAGVSHAKTGFFDSEAILRMMDAVSRKALSRYGAFVRRRAQTSIRYRDKAAAPGQPPSGHRSMTRTRTNRKTGEKKKQQVSPLRELIFFSWDPETRSVVVGPVLSKQPGTGPNRRPKSGTVPSTLEAGGAITVEEVLRRGRWRRIDLYDRRQIAGLPTRLVTRMIHQHAFMRPADAAERPRLMEFFKEQAI